MSVSVIAKLAIQKGKEKDFEKLFAALQKKVRDNEKGCLYYDLVRSKEESNIYFVMERYASQDALDAHGKSAYFIEAQKPLGGLIAAAPEITYLDYVS